MLHQHTKTARCLCMVMIQVRTKLGSAIFGRGPVANVATLRSGRFSGTGVIIKWVFVLFSVPFVICLFCYERAFHGIEAKKVLKRSTGCGGSISAIDDLKSLE